MCQSRVNMNVSCRSGPSNASGPISSNYRGRSSLSGRLDQTQPALVVWLQLLGNSGEKPAAGLLEAGLNKHLCSSPAGLGGQGVGQINV